MIEGWVILAQLAAYFPYYVLLVLVPMIIRFAIERLMGIDHEVFEMPPPPVRSLFSYEASFREFVHVALYLPFFEELVFRAVPLWLLGAWGLYIGSAIWVLMHPAWQLLYLYGYPTSKKVGYTLTCTFFYTCTAVFYGMMWLAGAGAAAIIYHMAHNLWITAAERLRRVEIRLGRRKREEEYEFVKPRRAPSRFVFVTRKGEREEVESTVFVRRKDKNKEA